MAWVVKRGEGGFYCFFSRCGPLTLPQDLAYTSIQPPSKASIQPLSKAGIYTYLQSSEARPDPADPRYAPLPSADTMPQVQQPIVQIGMSALREQAPKIFGLGALGVR